MSKNIETHLHEKRIFKPSKEFSKQARISSMAEYKALYQESIDKPSTFWAREAKELSWQKKWTKVLNWKAPFAEWFVGGKLNVSESCLDQHLSTHRRNKAAIIWEGEPGETRTLTYLQLHREVCIFSNILLKQGIKAKDRVIIYMPMVPEAAVAMLACARIGAVHSVVFGGFSADSIADRIEDSGATAVITADGGYRRGKVVPLKDSVDAALEKQSGVKTVIVHQRTGGKIAMKKGRDVYWHEEAAQVSSVHEAKAFDSEHPLFILYTSGSTGKPKGILHSSAGYLTGAYTTCKYIFDMRDDDVYWCTADVGWITGHTYIVYGPLANGVTQVMYEGAPNYPDFGRFWDMVERHKVSIFYTAPTAIRAFIKAGDHFPEKHDLSSLRLLGTVGEPINPEAWMWYHEKIGGERCPIVDTWWQTETGAIMISPLPGVTPTIPGTATLPFFGVDAAILDENGNECGPNEGGKLVIRKPWPSMTRTIYKDKARFRKTYWKDYEGKYTAGDGAFRDRKGNFWIVGRLDDVLNVSGHRLGTAEVESALVEHNSVAEAAVVGRPHEIKGQGIVAFVTLKEGVLDSPELNQELRTHVAQAIGAIARPDEIHFAPALPKTRSGKIMRRLLKELVSSGKVSGNITTLEDVQVIEALQKSIAQANS
ncbi:acetate--CoA ligase [Roseibacillus persicicus]|uniref:Acetyl-coenzyme A synthetase n=1 Tax=Roseibacillus persicicus TaxID=454148 RepID=A0A918WH33_9BACT|nr:acetate--CoA ligase [Roseibacillus persicicus]MDQ8189984.1 acetate--CoA ligase [Roseibacillus persicicus]GHC50963.1 acetyl-coenzyme A synthetase [Roseibacillus persicicus]